MINVGLINYTQFIAAAPGAPAWSMAMRGQFIMLISPISMLLSVINNSLVPVCKQSLCSMGTHCTAGNEWIIGGWLLMLDA